MNQPSQPPPLPPAGRPSSGGRSLVGGLPWQQAAGDAVAPPAGTGWVLAESEKPPVRQRRPGLLDETEPLGPLDLFTTVPWRRLLAAAMQSSPPWTVSLMVHLVIVLVLILVSVQVTSQPRLSLTLEFAPQAGPPGPPAVDLPLAPPDEVDATAVENELAFSEKPPVKDAIAAPAVERLVPDFQPATAARPTVAIGTLLDGRQEGSRKKLVAAGGGSDQTERAVELALRWLVQQQENRGTYAGLWSLVGPYPDGGSEENRVAATAMALLALQGAGNTPQSGEHAQAVAAGWQAIVKTQTEAGNFSPASDRHTSAAGSMYGHGQLTMALCEAFALTSSARLEEPARRAVRYCLAAQLPDGGWRYHLPDADETGLRNSWKNRGDLSVTGWFLLALKTAEIAGLHEPGIEKAYARAGVFIEQLRIVPREPNGQPQTVADEPADVELGYDYQLNPLAPFRKFQSAISAEAILGRLFLGTPPDDPHVVAVVDRLMNESPIWFPPLPDDRRGEVEFAALPQRTVRGGEKNIYAWYYITQVCHHVGGRAWQRWNRQLRTLLPRHQEQAGRNKGSWSPALDLYGVKGGRLFTTALSACMLESYYRHLPLFGQEGAANRTATPPKKEIQLKSER